MEKKHLGYGYLIGIFGVDIVLNRLGAGLAEVLRRDLHEVGDGGLRLISKPTDAVWPIEIVSGNTYKYKHRDSALG